MHLNAKSATLLIVDLQAKLMPHIAEGQRVVETCNKALVLAHSFGMPVTVTEQLPEKLGPTLPVITEGLPGDHALLTKSTFSCLGDDAIKKHLARLGRKQILLCGTETHICVALTARDLLEAGYEVALISDGVSSRDGAKSARALETLTALGVWVMPFETLAYDLMGQAGTDHFRSLLHLFK